tara:strand:+ start:168 stop:689 length:522 start_codon:yes stop_codon:yes gene_type:complete
MGQEFVIKSTALEDKINQLLPSQGGFQAGVDLSASTTIIPIVDLTESAEGSDVREDLQTAFSHKTAGEQSVNNTTATIINTTGYWRLNYVFAGPPVSGAGTGAGILINDGATSKVVVAITINSGTSGYIVDRGSIVVKLEAGDSVILESSGSTITSRCAFRQIADVNGNLIDP